MKSILPTAFLVIVLLLIALLLVGLMGSKNVTMLSDTKARIEVDGELSLMWMGGKLFYEISREGDNVVVSSLFPERYKLCGPGCTIKVPFGFFEELLVTENADGSLTVEWPWSYSAL